MSRAIRRHHEKRIKKNISKWKSIQGWLSIPDNAPRAIGRTAACRALCSCTMCGNPRRHFGERKLNEQVHILILEEELNQIEE